MPRKADDREGLFKVFFEQAAVGVSQIDTRTGQFVRINKKFCDIFGYTLQEMVTLDFQSITHPDDLKPDLDNMERLKSGEIAEFTMQKRYLKKDGSIVWGDLTVSPMWQPGEAPDYHIAIVQDITKREQAEQELQSRQRDYATLFDTVKGGIIVTDREGHITLANKEAELLLGLRQSDIRGRRFDDPDWEVCRFDGSPMPSEEMAGPLAMKDKQAVTNVEMGVRRPDGQIVWLTVNATPMIDDDGEVSGIIGSFTDITEYRRIRRDLEQSKDYAENLIQTANVIVVALDAKGDVVVFNQTAQEVTGYTLEDLQGVNWFEVVVPKELYPEVWKEFERLQEAGIPRRFENPIRTKDGEERHIVWQNNQIRGHEGAIDGTISFGLDITDKLRSDEERVRLEKQLEQAQRLDALGSLAGGIAHDFNNLLAGLFGYLEMARLDAHDGDVVRDCLDKSLVAFGKAKDLTRQLLTFARGGDPVKCPVELATLLSESRDLALAGSAIQWDLELGEGLWRVEADENQLSQVFGNILLNARQAMPEGGRVRVVCANRVIAASEGELLPAGEFVEVSIRDEGVGMDEVALARVFEPFFTTKRAGSGLGLSTAYSIVEKHGGKISVESRVGNGTTVRVLLPASRGAAPKAHKAREGPRKLAGRVLVMDDETLVLATTRAMLQRIGFTVETALDGDEAIESFQRARAEHRRFSFVILDLTVPGGMGGEETVRRLEAIDPDVKAIVASGYSESAALAEPHRYGFRACLTKPFTVAELTRVVEQVLDDADLTP